MGTAVAKIAPKPTPPMLLSEYQQAIEHVKELQTLAEGKRWSEKIEALTAWAKIYHDDQLLKQAKRLKLHAHRRMYELAAEFGGRFSAVLREHGFTQHEITKIKAVGRVQERVFDEAVTSDTPPSPGALYGTHLAPGQAVSSIGGLRRFVRLVGREDAAAAFREQGCTTEDANELIGWLLDVAGSNLQQRPWTLERHERSRKHHETNPKHVAHLRMGIQKFRDMLEARWK